MNLAGRAFQMLTPVAQNMPTSISSARTATATTVVREKTAISCALGGRMEANIKKPGAVEFAQIFGKARANKAACVICSVQRRGAMVAPIKTRWAAKNASDGV